MHYDKTTTGLLDDRSHKKKKTSKDLSGCNKSEIKIGAIHISGWLI